MNGHQNDDVAFRLIGQKLPSQIQDENSSDSWGEQHIHPSTRTVRHGSNGIRRFWMYAMFERDRDEHMC